MKKSLALAEVIKARSDPVICVPALDAHVLSTCSSILFVSTVIEPYQVQIEGSQMLVALAQAPRYVNTVPLYIQETKLHPSRPYEND